MPLPFLSVPQFPNVPNVPGVPPVLRNVVAQITDQFTVLSADTALVPLDTSQSQWGLFDDDGGQPIEADSVISVDFRKEYEDSDYPIEDGGFQSYNKVEKPYDARLIFTKGGSNADRTAFFTQLQTVLASLDLYTVVMPEFSYDGANVVHYDFARKAEKGATLLTAEVWVKEIRVTATETFSQTAQPNGTDPTNDGAVQPIAPDAAVQGALLGGWN